MNWIGLLWLSLQFAQMKMICISSWLSLPDILGHTHKLVLCASYKMPGVAMRTVQIRTLDPKWCVHTAKDILARAGPGRAFIRGTFFGRF